MGGVDGSWMETRRERGRWTYQVPSQLVVRMLKHHMRYRFDKSRRESAHFEMRSTNIGTKVKGSTETKRLDSTFKQVNQYSQKKSPLHKIISTFLPSSAPSRLLSKHLPSIYLCSSTYLPNVDTSPSLPCAPHSPTMAFLFWAAVAAVGTAVTLGGGTLGLSSQ